MNHNAKDNSDSAERINRLKESLEKNEERLSDFQKCIDQLKGIVEGSNGPKEKQSGSA